MIVQTNFIKGRMNKSVDERLVPLGEYVDALNVRLGSTETTEIGAVENSKGNTLLTPSVEYLGNSLSSSARCIGAFQDGMRETIYWFVHDPANISSSTGKVDLILSFETSTSTLLYHVISETVLNFDPAFLITGVDKIDEYLYFTDDKNPPRYINVKRNYNVDTDPTDPLEEEDISVILKIPGFEDSTATTDPLGTPYVDLIDVAGQENYMEYRFISFAYRYRYLDGGYSAISLFTNPAFQPSDFRFSFQNYNNDSMINRFNAADVTFSTGSKRVKEVQLLYKESGSNAIYVIKRFNKSDLGWSDDSFYTHRFANSEIYSLLPDDELLRLYDNVPLRAKAQTLQGNRLMYGNYVEQYDIRRTDGGSIIDIRYDLESLSAEVGGEFFPTPTTANANWSIENPANIVSLPDGEIEFDLSALTATNPTIPIGSQLSFRFSVNNSFENNNGGSKIQTPPYLATSPFFLTLNFTCPTDYTSINALTSSLEFQEAFGTIANMQPVIPTNTTDQGATLTDKFNAAVDPLVNSMVFVNSAIDGTCPSPIGAFPPTISICQQQPVKITATTNGFKVQLPAVQYYYDNGSGGDISVQYNYYTFNAAATYASFLTTSNTLSLHSNRDYEVGVVYMDEYGRASTVQVSDTNTIFFPPSNSVSKNQIKVNLQSVAPHWAKHYKFVCKPSEGAYNTVFSYIFYQQGENQDTNVAESFVPDSSSYWFKLEGDSQALVSVGDLLTVKMDASGPVTTFQQAEVLDKQSCFSNQITTGSLPGLYIKLKPSGWSVANNGIVNIKDSKTNQGKRTSGCGDTQINNVSLNDPDGGGAGTPKAATIPAGSRVRIRVHNNGGGDNNFELIFDKTYTASIDYLNFYDWAIGDDLQGSMIAGNAEFNKNLQIHFDPTLYTPSQPTLPSTCFDIKIAVREEGVAPNKTQFLCNNGSIPGFFGGGGGKPKVRLEVDITRADGLFLFETEPLEADPNLFFDASNLLDIYTDPGTGLNYHRAKRDFVPGSNAEVPASGSIDQTPTNPLTTVLDFANCYTFGNGCESFRIQDRIDGKSFNLGNRVLAVSNQDYKQAHRFAGMSYSGVYSDSTNVNNLNEFNLGLANFKDLEVRFGPIMKLYARQTDILVLQEDKISYVLAGKNVISDSTGGGAIISVPEVLGTQIARTEDYGISFNPESFVFWGSSMFFTDSKRGAVLHLKGGSQGSDALNVISDQGMRSYFRSQFNDQITTQKLGGYDPYMDEYVLSSNNIKVPLEPVEIPCGQRIDQVNNSDAFTYTATLGNVIGQVSINYGVSTGPITIDVVWNGTTFTSGPVNGVGSFSFNKSAASPETATVTVTPASRQASYSLSVTCPPEEELTVVQVVANTNNTNGQDIHIEYEWNDGLTFSPVLQNAVSLSNTFSAFYSSQTGVRSVGGFPYSGVDITLRTNKISLDNFNFNLATNKFKILSSNVLYENTAADITSLLATATDVTPIVNPSTNIFEATATAFNIPSGNQYLYLVWDLRDIIYNKLCYSATSADDVCCDCTEDCNTAFFSPSEFTQNQACAMNTDSFGAQQYAFTSNSSIPVLGDTVYANTNCSVDVYPTAGFYVVDPTAPATANPKNWVEIGALGIVINSGTC